MRVLNHSAAWIAVFVLSTTNAFGQAAPAAHRLGSSGEGGCFLARDAHVYCWGTNSFGILGTPGAPNRPAAAAVPGLDGVTDISVSSDHVCALRNDATVWCWGTNTMGQLGSGRPTGYSRFPLPTFAPTQVPGVANVAQVAATGSSTCVLLRDGTVRCFGSVLLSGTGGHAGARITPSTPRGLPPIARLHPTTLGMYAVGTDGSVWAWGDSNDLSQLGSGSSALIVPTRVSRVTNLSSLSSSAGNICVVDTNGGVSCWGGNESNVLGPGTNARCTIEGVGGPPETIPCRRTPQRIPGITDAAEVALHGPAIVVRRRDGSLSSWGLNARGELLDPSATPRTTPAPVPGISGVDEISSNNSGGLCLRMGERVSCWNATARRMDTIAGLP